MTDPAGRMVHIALGVRDSVPVVKGFGIHACFLDGQCRELEAPKRLYLFTPWGSWIVGESSQVWFPVIGYTDRWSPVAWHPDRRRA